MTIPLVARLRIERPGRRLNLWLPLFLFWLLLLPVAIVTLPVVAIVLAVLGRRPLALFAAYWGILSAMSGAHVEIATRRASVFMHVY